MFDLSHSKLEQCEIILNVTRSSLNPKARRVVFVTATIIVNKLL